MSEQSPTPRRSTRIPLDVLVEVQGKGAAHAGQTVNVNLHGALLRIVAPLKLGDRVTIHVHSTGKSASGTVVFVHADTSQCGIELQIPENIWGVPPGLELGQVVIRFSTMSANRIEGSESRYRKRSINLGSNGAPTRVTCPLL